MSEVDYRRLGEVDGGYLAAGGMEANLRERMNLHSSWYRRIDGRLGMVSAIDPRLLYLYSQMR